MRSGMPALRAAASGSQSEGLVGDEGGRTGHGPSSVTTQGAQDALRAMAFPGELINGLRLAGLDGNWALKRGW